MVRLRAAGVLAALVALTLWVLVVPQGTAVAAYKVPPLTGPVVDRANLLSAEEVANLSDILRRLHDKGGSQISILTEPDLGGLEIEEASIKVTDAWKLGSASKDNGVLILVAKKERGVRIEVGQGLEGDLPDAYARRIVDDVMVPFMRNGDFGGGLEAGVAAIIARTDPGIDLGLNASRRPVTWSRSRGQTPLPLPFSFFIVIVSFIIVWMLRKHTGSGYGRSGRWMSSSSGWGGSSGGSSWGGGGGGFSGGGASGKW